MYGIYRKIICSKERCYQIPKLNIYFTTVNTNPVFSIKGSCDTRRGGYIIYYNTNDAGIPRASHNG